MGHSSDGLQAGGAETVDGLSGNVVRQLSAVDDQTAGIQVQLVDGHGAAGDDVADLLRMLLDVGNLGDDTLQGLGSVVNGMHISETAFAGAAARGSAVCNNNRCGHWNYLLNIIIFLWNTLLFCMERVHTLVLYHTFLENPQFFQCSSIKNKSGFR